MASFPRLVICDDDADLLSSLERALKGEFACLLASTGEELSDLLHSSPDLVLLDIRLSDDVADREGLELLQEVRSFWPDLPVIMMTAYGDVDIAVEAMKLGADDFIDKNRASVPEIRKSLRRALEDSLLRRRVFGLEREVSRLSTSELIGEHPLMSQMREAIATVAADARVTVLICGETGSGKELVARAIHRRGGRKKQPFVPVALCALAADVIDSELFGSVAGGFTDAKTRTGYVGEANGGVLFLDEVAVTPPATQAKLLRFLEERVYQRVGSTDPMGVDVQVVAATNQDLSELCRSGEFREDLYYRLKAFVIEVPPLRQRTDDIELLTKHFLRRLRAESRTRVQTIDIEVLESFRQYSWPGNVRELKNVVENLVLRAGPNAAMIDASLLPSEFQTNTAEQSRIESPKSFLALPLEESLARHELCCIEAALSSSGGRKAEAAALLGLNDRFALRRRVRAISSRFPSILPDFPVLGGCFGERRPGAGDGT